MFGDTEGIEPGVEGDVKDPEPSDTERIASYQMRIHLRRDAGSNLEPLTIDEISALLKESFGAGYSVTVTGERLDI